MSTSHRSGGLKQSNKNHKSSKSSKRALSRKLGAGRIEKAKKNASKSKLGAASSARQNRQNEAAIRRKSKKAVSQSKRRIGSTSSETDVPKIVGVLCLSEGRLGPEGEGRMEESDIRRYISSLPSTEPSKSDVTVTTVPQLKGQFQLITPSDFSSSSSDYLSGVLKMALASDILLVAFDGVSALSEAIKAEGDNVHTTDGDEEYPNLLSPSGERALAALKAQGIPNITSLLVLPDGSVEASAVSKKNGGLTKGNRRKIDDLRKYVSRFLRGEVGEDVKVVEDDSIPLASEGSPGSSAMDAPAPSNSLALPPPPPLIRALISAPASAVQFTSLSPRNYLLSTEYSHDAASSTFAVTGYLRGNGAMDANNLVHIAGVGTFQVDSIEVVQKQRKNNNGNVEEAAGRIVRPKEGEREQLEMFATPDGLDGEQNLVGFDGDDQLAEFDDMDEEEVEEEKTARPAGWSDYQSAWLEDADQDDLKSIGSEGEEYDRGELSDMFNKKGDKNPDDDDGMADMEDDMEVSEAERKELAKRRRKAEEEMEFPDEVQVGDGEVASSRFARYRSLQSFRKSAWDPKENLPEDYASLFHFSNFKATARSVLSEQKEISSEMLKVAQNAKKKNDNDNDNVDMKDGDDDSDDEDSYDLSTCVSSNTRVKITLANFNQEHFAAASASRTLSLCSLLPHENKMSVLHFNICQTLKCETSDDSGVDNPVKSKDVLTFQVGWRTWQSKPIFSQNNLNSDKHKFERFLTPGAYMACSAYGPVTYGPCPVLIWREPRPGQKMRQLVAVGSVMNADADRVVIKRIILTGYPVRVHKRTATVKYMFYNPEDVKWFKPAGLTTKHGLQGNIMESIGTHGAMKCLFNQPIKQHDTVCLILYKRIYPKYEGSSEALTVV
ncbi:hypothetical protein TrVE_jg5526 [Triparma verrucosa]|uniref:Uncharacterized protein n=1 Tax=Triparma verrucosa TaxID=1606542 RepID=A0A9W7BPW0_9STRA|nr:hypothetical protein TrVE_jg5526 [Triparma verrucosa]